MKCIVFRCQKHVGSPLLARTRGLRPPALDLCPEHQREYNKAFDVHFAPYLAPGARQKLARAMGRVTLADAAIAEALSAWRLRSWQSHWLQQVDLELLYHSDPPPERPSAPEVKPRAQEPLPLAATKVGQAVLAKRAAEEALLEQRLKAEVKEFAKGQRQVLELELKTKRAAEEVARKKAKA